PCAVTARVAVALALRVALEHVEGASLRVDERLAEARRLQGDGEGGGGSTRRTAGGRWRRRGGRSRRVARRTFARTAPPRGEDERAYRQRREQGERATELHRISSSADAAVVRTGRGRGSAEVTWECAVVCHLGIG